MPSGLSKRREGLRCLKYTPPTETPGNWRNVLMLISDGPCPKWVMARCPDGLWHESPQFLDEGSEDIPINEPGPWIDLKDIEIASGIDGRGKRNA